jgi:hypothetical protein
VLTLEAKEWVELFKTHDVDVTVSLDGPAETLLAFNFSSQDNAKKLAGFTVFCQPPGQVPGYYLQNNLQFEDPSKHSVMKDMEMTS